MVENADWASQPPVGFNRDQSNLCFMSTEKPVKKQKITHHTCNTKSLITNSHDQNRQTFAIIPFETSTKNISSKIKTNKKSNLLAKTFGDYLTEKEEGNIRIVSQNINCLGINKHNNQKEERAKNWLIQNNVDIFGWQETGIAFHLLPKSKRLFSRLQDIRWNKIRVSSSNNKHEKNGIFQYGGTAVTAVDEAAHRIKCTGSDLTGLGRWSWILFEGKANHLTRVISAYVPCRSSDNRRQTVYNQQKRYFWKRGIQQCPRKLMHQHLTQQIQTWQNQGDNIVLMIDMNENLANMGPLQTMLKYECQLIDPIRERYQKKDQTLPATSLTGSCPIDSIFVSASLQNIVRGGWIRLEDSIGDHRSIFIDIPTKILLGENPFKIHRITARRLVCNQPKVVQKYNELLNEQLNNQFTFQQYYKVQEMYKTNQISDHEYIMKLNKLDRAITNSIRFAEKRCRKLRAGHVPFSPEIQEAGEIINVWNNIIRKKKGCNISSSYLKRISKKVGILININQISLQECEIERKLATKKYRKLKRNASQNREQFLQKLAQDHANRGNTTASSIIAQMTRIEEIRASYRRIKVVTKPYYGTTEKVLIANERNGEEISTDKKKIEEALCEENKRKFTEAYSSPFLQQPLLQQLGQTAVSQTAKSILNGTYYSSTPISPKTKKFIQKLQKPPLIAESPTNDEICSLEEAKHYWRKKREKTNSSMSQRHIGTYKALTFDNLETLSMINTISNSAFRLGEPLERWTNDLDVSLLKKPNKFRPSELRTIGTLEADFNQQASLHFSKRMIHNGIMKSAIPNSQYAKKGNRAIEAAIVKVLFYDYLRLTRRNGSFIMMDLKNCFDRMAHPVTSLAVQRLGVSEKITQCMIKTLCKMKHYIRTAYGDSEWAYGGDENKPLQGAIQGNGAASPMFVAISCVILAYLESAIKGIYVMTAISLTIYSLTAIMYVDDTDILIAATNRDDGADQIQIKSQKAATAYQDGVKQTGGNVRPEKCRWYLISFTWRAGKWSYQKESEHQITLEDENGNTQIVTRLQTDQGFKGLGIITAPDGNWNDHVKYIINEKIKPWNQSIQSSYLQRQDVYRAAFTSIFKTIDYTLPATSMSTSQCQSINSELHKRFLPKIGIDSHLPLVYRYSPKKYQGLASLNVETKQYIENLKMFLYHVSTGSQLGKSIQLILEAMHIQMGTHLHIFSLPYDKYKCLNTSGWINHIWKMSWKYNIKVRGYYEKPTIAREHDYALMDRLIEADLYNDDDIQKINRCRLYLNVINISDIVNGQGTRISTPILQHRRDHERRSKYQWPVQPYPPKSDWSAWDDAIHNIWTKSETYVIHKKLGAWTNTPHFETDWKYSTTTQLLYYKISSFAMNVYSRQQSSQSRAENNQFHQVGIINIDHTPNDCKTAIVNRNNLSKPILETSYPSQITYMNMEQEQLHHEIDKFFKQVTPPTSSTKLIKDIINGDAIAVTDASVSPYTGVGASSFVITSLDLQTSYSGSHGVPKGSEKMDSYRAELYGIFSILLTLHDIINEYNITSGMITIACDNKASLNNSLLYKNRTSITQGSFDILWAIHDLLQDIPIKIIPKHVKAHQDQKKEMQQLTILETLNCIVDKKAGEYRQYVENNTDYEYCKIHWFSNWFCMIENDRITANLEPRINDWIYAKEMKKYLIQNKHYHKDSFEYIDWIAVEKAAATLTNTKQIWLTKHVSGFCATASKMHKRKLWENELCPLCGIEKENTSHIMMCPDTRARTQFKKSLMKLDQYMKNSYTHPSIRSTIISTLEDHGSKNFLTNIPSYEYDRDFEIAANQQNKIGWLGMMNGHISKKWSEIQLKHFIQMFQNPPSVQNWAKNIVLKMYEISHSMWKNRNDIVHDNVEEKLNQRESNKLQKQIIDMYNEGSARVLNIHRYMFEDELENILARTVEEKKFWIDTIIASKECCEHRDNELQNMCEIQRMYATVPD